MSIIEKPGEYTTAESKKAEVIAIRNNIAIGFLGPNPMAWHINGMPCIGYPSIAISGPWIEPKKPVEGWVNVYDKHFAFYTTRKQADAWAGADCIACVFVRECETPEEKT